MSAIVLGSTQLPAMPLYQTKSCTASVTTHDAEIDPFPVIYASPGGRAQGLGTRNDPVDLHAGLSRVSADTVLELFGGIYRIANGGICGCAFQSSRRGR